MLFVLTMLTVLAIGWQGDKRSCERSAGVRASLTIYYQGQAERAGARAGVERGQARLLDLQAQAAARQALGRVRSLDCSALPPPTR